MQVALMKQRVDDHERRHEEFMRSTTIALKELVEKSRGFERTLQEWATIRRTLAWIGSAIIALSGLAGWMINHFLPIKS